MNNVHDLAGIKKWRFSENDPVFDAGVGSVLNAAGEVSS